LYENIRTNRHVAGIIDADVVPLPLCAKAQQQEAQQGQDRETFYVDKTRPADTVKIHELHIARLNFIQKLRIAGNKTMIAVTFLQDIRHTDFFGVLEAVWSLKTCVF